MAQALLGAINMTFGAEATEDPHRSTYVDMIESIEMCIYMESDYRAYARAWARTKDGYTEASENAATPTGADAPAMAPPRPVHVSSEPAMGTASFDSPAASPGGAAPGSPPQMPPASPPQMPPVQDY